MEPQEREAPQEREETEEATVLPVAMETQEAQERTSRYRFLNAMKQYLVKLYGADGSTLKRVIQDKYLRKAPTFSERMNGGQGDITLDTSLDPEDFGDIDIDYVCDVYIADDDNPDGKLKIYQGVIQQIEPYAQDNISGVKIIAQGTATTLTFDYWRDSGTYTFTKNDDANTVFAEVITQHQADESLNLIAGTDIDDPGVTINQEFAQLTWHASLTKIQELCPEGWYWYLGADGIVKLKPKPSSATHKFILGKHIQFRAPKSAKKMFNVVRVIRDGDIAKDYTNVAAGNRRRLKILNDSGILDETTSDQKGNKFLDENDTPSNKTELTVFDTYDIESIKPGETCTILNLKKGMNFFGSNMQIVGITYSGNKVTLELEEAVGDIGAELTRFVQGR